MVEPLVTFPVWWCSNCHYTFRALGNICPRCGMVATVKLAPKKLKQDERK